MSKPSPKPSASPRRPARFGRRFRWLLLIAAPLVFFGGAEGLLRIMGVGHATDLFIPDERPGFYRTNPRFTALFFPAHFNLKPLNFRLARQKPDDTVRVFALGESAVFGTPEPGFGFVAQLRAQLRAAYPGKKIEVYNLGIPAINSHVAYRIAGDLAPLAPDLVLIYLGNNEVVGPYGPGSVNLPTPLPVAVVRASAWARSLRLGQLLENVMTRFRRGSGEAHEWRGMRTFSDNLVRGNDPQLAAVYANFATNLRDIVKLAQSGGAKVVLSTVVANLKDHAPFASLHRADLSDPDRKTWQGLYDDGVRAWKLRQHDHALERLEAAAKIDPQFADQHFLLGQIREKRGETNLARQHYLDALHWDALRFRPDAQINAIIRAVAREAAVRLVDAAREFGAELESAAPIAGRELLFEHVHFNLEGNFRLARLLAPECAAALFSGSPPGAWLTGEESAAAVGCTDYGRLGMLYGIGNLTKVPPFTNQATFARDQTRLRTETIELETRLKAPEALRRAAEQAAIAVARDPENPQLLIHHEEIAVQAGDLSQAISLIDRAANLQPRAPELMLKRANLLLLLKRFDEAETELRNAWRIDPWFFPACQTLGELWSQTAQFAKGKLFFEDLLKRFPRHHYLRLAYADLLLRGGDASAAEQECLRVLREDPADEGALERLGRLYSQTRRSDAALRLMIDAAKHQPKNHLNNTRLAQIFDAKNDATRTVEFMKAATESGPVSAAQRWRLVQRLAELNRREEIMEQLLEARDAATAERNSDLQQQIAALIRRLGSGEN